MQPSIVTPVMTTVITALLVSLAAATCDDGSPGFPLPLPTNGAGVPVCADGFYCPHINGTNRSTWPVMCPPSPKCQIDRLNGEICNKPAASDPFEPRLCEKRYYCPTPQTKLRCPSGHYCFKGTKTPRKCPFLSYCPKGTKKPLPLFPVLCALLSTAAVVALFVLYDKWYRIRLPNTASLFSLKSEHTLENLQRSFESASFEATSAMPNEPFDSPVPHGPVPEPSFHSDHDSARRLMRVLSGEMDSSSLFRDRALSKHLPSMKALIAAFERSRGTSPPVQIDATGVTVTMPDGKVLLHGVDGTMQPGKVTAIMGPTGAGKTVFMTTLLGGLDPEWTVGGSFKVNGVETRFGGIRRQIGFVPQDDVLHTELSIDGNLYFSSESRLPSQWTPEQRAELREAILQQLRLDDQRRTVVGAGGSGISASQRKRVSVASEMAAAPLVLFLDEPTSGLDPTTSLELIRLLKDIALAVRLTVVTVVHQPRVEIWDELDEVLLLAPGGRTVFQGSQADAVDYFMDHGAPITPRDNPADVIMDTIAADAEKLTALWEADGHTLECPTSDVSLVPAASDQASFLRQMALVHLRSIEKQLAVPMNLVVEVGVMVLCGCILGFSVRTSTLTGVYLPPYDRISPIPFTSVFPQLALYLLMSLGLSASVAGVAMFGRERPQYFRDAQAGLSRVAYFFGNATSAVYRVLFCSLWFVACYLALGTSMLSFGVFFSLVTLGYLCFYAAAASASVFFDAGVAPLMAGLLSVLVSVFSGFISFPVWLKKGFFTFYMAQVIQEENYQPVKHWTTSAMSHNYQTGQRGLSFAVIVLWLLILNGAALAVMLFTHRSRQRC